MPHGKWPIRWRKRRKPRTGLLCVALCRQHKRVLNEQAEIRTSLMVNGAATVQAWDWMFYAEQVRRKNMR